MRKQKATRRKGAQQRGPRQHTNQQFQVQVNFPSATNLTPDEIASIKQVEQSVANLLVDSRKMLREGDPVEFLTYASAFVQDMSVSDLVGSEGDISGGDEDSSPLSVMAYGLSQTPYAESTALLTAINAITTDITLRENISAVLATRRHPLPVWLQHLDEAHLATPVYYFHCLGDHGFGIGFGIHLADGTDIGCILMVDHDEDGVVDPVGIGAGPIDDLLEMLRSSDDGPDLIAEIDPSLARAVLEHGLTISDSKWPSFDGEPEAMEWLMQRPLIRWCLRLLPDGAELPDPSYWYGPDVLGPLACGHPEHNHFENDDSDTKEIINDIIYYGNFLMGKVGGPKILANLTATPLADRKFNIARIPEDIREVVAEVLNWCDRCAEEMFDLEFRTAFREFVSLVATRAPNEFRSRSSAKRTAAAIVWLIHRMNLPRFEFAPKWSTDKELLAWFGITGSVANRAKRLLEAVGGKMEPGNNPLFAEPTLLVSAHREWIIELRNIYLPNQVLRSIEQTATPGIFDHPKPATKGSAFGLAAGT